jgi:hypothetical protein
MPLVWQRAKKAKLHILFKDMQRGIPENIEATKDWAFSSEDTKGEQAWHTKLKTIQALCSRTPGRKEKPTPICPEKLWSMVSSIG